MADSGSTSPAVVASVPREPENEDLIDLGRILETIWRGKYLIAVLAMMATLLGGFYAFRVAEPVFRATTVIVLDPAQQSLLSLESVASDLRGDFATINTEVEVLKSRSLLGDVVDQLNLTEDPEFNPRLEPPSPMDNVTAQVRSFFSGNEVRDPSARPPENPTRTRDRAVSRLSGRITVRNIPLSRVFQITVQSDNGVKSARIADTLAERYIADQLAVKFAASEQATVFLTDRVADLKGQLESAEAELTQFNAGTNLISAEALRAQEIQLKEIRDRIASGRLTAQQSSTQLEALEAASTREEQAAAANDQQLTRLLPRAQTDDQIAQAFDTRYNQIVARAALESDRALQQSDALEQSRSVLEAEIASQSEDLITQQQLSREAESVRLLYEYFLNRLQETTAQEGIQQADSRVLSPAVVPGGAASPRKNLIMMISMVIGAMLGVGLVLLYEARQNGFRTAQDLERHTGYAVMGQIPRIPTRNRKRTLNYLIEKPASTAAEAYRNLRTSLMLSNVDNPPQVIISTSCVPGEGKTTNSLALAQNLTGLGKKVLLIEGDIRRRTFAQYFPNIPDQGLVSVLSGDVSLEDALVKDNTLNASVLAGEKTSVNAADIFASEKFKTLITDLRSQFDTIIIDTPPVLVVPDARIIAEVVDAILFTVEWDKTSKSQIDEAMRMFHSAGQRVTGFVLSQINARRMKAYGYGGRYGAYSGYGASYYQN